VKETASAELTLRSVVVTLVIMDGPMGTELAARGVPTPSPGWSAHAIRSHPEFVARIHADYAAAGAVVHRANTFRAQPRIFGAGFAALVHEAVALARSSVSHGRIAGSIAPIEDCYRPDLTPPEPEARRLHRAHAEALAAAGCDLLICETFPHGGEARVAVEEAARTGLPTWAALTAGPDAALMSPAAMEEAARACAESGASAVLVCCTAAERTLAFVERLARVGIAFGAYANSGYAPHAVSVERYRRLAARWVDCGATILGACCGTGPDHVAAIARAQEW
jgi:S-methylmethionine-dependent homocysteine/selenocysteine methylase